MFRVEDGATEAGKLLYGAAAAAAAAGLQS
jgi:hypothetical protein